MQRFPGSRLPSFQFSNPCPSARPSPFFLITKSLTWLLSPDNTHARLFLWTCKEFFSSFYVCLFVCCRYQYADRLLWSVIRRKTKNCQHIVQQDVNLLKHVFLVFFRKLRWEHPCQSSTETTNNSAVPKNSSRVLERFDSFEGRVLWLQKKLEFFPFKRG